MASLNFTNLSKHLATAKIDFDTDVFKALLVTSIPSVTDTTGDMDTWINRADVTNEHAATGNYVTGGFVVTPAAGGVLDLVNEKFSITFVDGAPAFASATISSVGAIIYKSTGLAADDLLVSFLDFGGTIVSTDGDYDVTFSTPLEITV